jgi:DNA-binding NarL/FixJ family response regulator
MPLAEHSNAKPGKGRVLIVDDHPIVRQGISQLINREADFEVCCEAGDAEQALQALKCCDDCSPLDIAIIDMSLPGVSGIELIKAIHADYPGMPVLVMSMHDESLYAERALRAGARGYIMKQEATEKVITALRHIMHGEIYVSDKMRSIILQRIVASPPETPSSPVSCLSDKELEVLRLIGKGLRTSDISVELSRSVKTIEAHRANIKEKLKLSNSTELIRFAVQWLESEQT